MSLLSNFPLDPLIIDFDERLISPTADDFKISLILMELTPSVLALLEFYWITLALVWLSSLESLFYSLNFLISIIFF